MKQIFTIAISSILLLSCKNSAQLTTEENTVQSEQTQNEQVSDKIQLNNNEKWKVNHEMKPYVLQGEELVNSYLQSNNTDYVTLAKQLKDLNNKLIKSCTMEGASHDELHKWLHPHLEMVGGLDTITDAEKAKETTKNIANSYQMYHQYFK